VPKCAIDAALATPNAHTITLGDGLPGIGQVDNSKMWERWEKRLVGCIFGSVNSRADIPRLLALYRDGLLDLDGMVTRTYPFEDINSGYQDMRDGKNIRGFLVM
jgi:Zn-dependent alcohol dehydrogenase